MIMNIDQVKQLSREIANLQKNNTIIDAAEALHTITDGHNQRHDDDDDEIDLVMDVGTLMIMMIMAMMIIMYDVDDVLFAP